VLPVTDANVNEIDPSDIEWVAVRGTGKGGQARNKTSNAVQMRHVPSSMVVRVETSRSQYHNRVSAMRLLAARLRAKRESDISQREIDLRRRQIGSGQRGDKIRTVRTQDGIVTDHQTGRRTTWVRYQKGHIEDVASPTTR
jgi:peptide chain release factor 1